VNDQDFAKIVLPAKLEITRLLPADPDRVWEFLVDPELRKLWFCAGETGSAPGEPFQMAFDHTLLSESEAPADSGCSEPMVMTGTIVTFDPPKELTYEWPGENESTTLVTICLQAEEDGTRLNLTHERLVNPEFKRGASAGWHTHLDLLVDLTNGKPTRDFWVQYNQLKKVYDERIGV